MARDNEAAARLMHRVLGDVEQSELSSETVEFVVSLTARPVRSRRLKGA
jgi:hypothetical protein